MMSVYKQRCQALLEKKTVDLKKINKKIIFLQIVQKNIFFVWKSGFLQIFWKLKI